MALCIDPEARWNVAAWFAHAASELLAHPAAFEVPRPDRPPLLVQHTYAHADRWLIFDRDGHCWDQDGYSVSPFGRIAGNVKHDSARFTLAEVWPPAHQMVTSEGAGTEDGKG